jgi:hypothetical protein
MGAGSKKHVKISELTHSVYIKFDIWVGVKGHKVALVTFKGFIFNYCIVLAK